MMDNVELVLDLLRAALGEEFKAYYDGDPDLIPQFNLPAIIVTKTGDSSQPYTNAEDGIEESLVVKVVLDKKDDWTNNVDPLNLTEKRLRNYVEARGADGRWLPNTVKGALRNGLPLQDGRRIGERMQLEIGVSPRPDDMITHEAHLTLTVQYPVQVQ